MVIRQRKKHYDKKYKVFSIRLDEEVKKELQNRRREKKLSWNLFLKKLIWKEKHL